MPPKKSTRDLLNQAREAARMIDSSIGNGQRALDLVNRVVNTPPEKLLGAALQGMGNALLNGRRPGPRQPRRP